MSRRSLRLLENKLGKRAIEEYCDEMAGIEKDKGNTTKVGETSEGGDVTNADLKVQLNTMMECM